MDIQTPARHIVVVLVVNLTKRKVNLGEDFLVRSFCDYLLSLCHGREALAGVPEHAGHETIAPSPNLFLLPPMTALRGRGTTVVTDLLSADAIFRPVARHTKLLLLR